MSYQKSRFNAKCLDNTKIWLGIDLAHHSLSEFEPYAFKPQALEPQAFEPPALKPLWLKGFVAVYCHSSFPERVLLPVYNFSTLPLYKKNDRYYISTVLGQEMYWKLNPNWLWNTNSLIFNVSLSRKKNSNSMYPPLGDKKEFSPHDE